MFLDLVPFRGHSGSSSSAGLSGGSDPHFLSHKDKGVSRLFLTCLICWVREQTTCDDSITTNTRTLCKRGSSDDSVLLKYGSYWNMEHDFKSGSFLWTAAAESNQGPCWEEDEWKPSNEESQQPAVFSLSASTLCATWWNLQTQQWVILITRKSAGFSGCCGITSWFWFWPAELPASASPTQLLLRRELTEQLADPTLWAGWRCPLEASAASTPF